MSSSPVRRRGDAHIDPATRIGTVRLTVADLARSRTFYERAIGLTTVADGGGTVALAAPQGGPLIELRGDGSAPARGRRATGLYHLAILLPSRVDLAVALTRLRAAGWPLEGASDHLVSEALYLADPDGNGIEICCDRPRDRWRWHEGRLAMATLGLDLDGLLDELDGSADRQPLAPAGTTIGHVHLKVADLRDAEEFYSGVLGFDVMVDSYPGALFLSAGGYHHHIGLNIWHSAGAAAPAPGAVGLRSFEIVVPSEGDLARALERVDAAGGEIRQLPEGALVHDPSGNGVLLRAA